LWAKCVFFIRFFYFVIIFICRFLQRGIFMARPIKETPTISGKDSRRFQEAMDNLVPISPEEREDQRRAYELLKSIATFPMP
jgi:hypothetical protein